MKTVYLLMFGREGAPGEVRGVYATLEGARAAALVFVKQFSGEWQDALDGNRWVNSDGDFISVGSWGVKA